MIKTGYGNKKQGLSKFVIVAPHAAGDDLNTKEISEKIANNLNAFFVINDKYIKPANSRSSLNPDIVEDFNKLHWSEKSQKYLWHDKNLDMKRFYADIVKYAEEARKCSGDGRAVIIYVHGIADKSEKVGIDIGFGAKYVNDKFKSGQEEMNECEDLKKDFGVVRARKSDMIKLKNILEKNLCKNYDLNVGLGELYVAWLRQNSVQYHADSDDYSFQLEISYLLRKSENIEYTSKMISNALREVY